MSEFPSIRYHELFEVWCNEKSDKRNNSVYNYIKQKYNIDDSRSDLTVIKKRVTIFVRM